VLLREDRRAKGIAERRAMGVHIEEAYRMHLQRQHAHGDGFFVAAALYGRASSVRAVVEECGGGRPIDIPAVLARFARQQPAAPASLLGGTGSGDGEGTLPPAARPAASAVPRALGPEEWGSVIDVSGVLQALVEVTVRDAVSESAVVQLFLPPGSKAGALEGFWDPCDGEDKALWLRYEFLGRVHEAGVTDEAPLKCPLRSELRHTAGAAAPQCCVCGAAALLAAPPGPNYGQAKRTQEIACAVPLGHRLVCRSCPCQAVTDAPKPPVSSCRALPPLCRARPQVCAALVCGAAGSCFGQRRTARQRWQPRCCTPLSCRAGSSRDPGCD